MVSWPSLWNWHGGSHTLSDICNLRIIQQRWGGGVTFDCRAYRTPSLRGITHASRDGNVLLITGKLSILQWPILILGLIIGNTSNILYDWSCVRVRALWRLNLIKMFHIYNVGLLSSECIGNSGRSRLQLERPGMVSITMEGVVLTALHSKPLLSVTILWDEIPWKVINYGVNCH